MSTKDIVYIGQDLGYWSDLEKRYSHTYQDAIFKFHHLKLTPTTVNETIYNLFNIKPSIIYIDVNEQDDHARNLGMILKRINFFDYIPVVALVNNVSQVEKLISIHYDFVFIKGVETHDVVYHPYKLKYHDEAKSGEFALAKLSAEIKLKEIARVGYYGLTSMHIETLNTLEKGRVVEVEHNIPKENMRTNYFVSEKMGEDSIYYGARHWVELDYLYVDPAKREDGSFSLNVEDLSEEDLNNKVMVTRNLKKWITENSSYGSRKRTKLLMIDPEMNYFKTNGKMIDGYDFVFRINESFNEDFKYLSRIGPDIVVYCYPEKNPELEDVDKTDVEKLTAIAENMESKEEDHDAILKSAISNLKKLGPQPPYLIVLNCSKYTSQTFQQQFNYQYALVNPNMIGMNILAQMIHQLEEKRLEKEELEINNKIATLRKSDPIKYAKVNKTYFDPPKYYVSKKLPISNALILRDAVLTEISESVCFFTLEEPINFGNYYLTHPFSFAVKVIPQDGKEYVKEGEVYKYHGLIHAIGEKEKMRLRQYVNDIYTQHKKELREQAAQEIQEVNKKFIEDKQKAELEAKQKEEQEKDAEIHPDKEADHSSDVNVPKESAESDTLDDLKKAE